MLGQIFFPSLGTKKYCKWCKKSLKHKEVKK